MTNPITWSPLQSTVFTETAESLRSLTVNAVAGSGKTTVIVEAANRAQEARVGVLAFNKSVATELQRRLPEDVPALTFNSCGFRTLIRASRRTRVEPNKLYHILQDSGVDRDLQSSVVRAIRLAKANAYGIGDGLPTMDDFVPLLDDYDIDVPSTQEDDFLRICSSIFATSVKDTDIVDFEDQLWMPVYYNLALPQHDLLFVDEAQDISPIQRAMIRKMSPRVIAVGDRNQAIYGFRGADHTSMDAISALYDSVELPLSVSYRCPQTIVELARTIVPEMEPHPSAPMGSVLYLEDYPSLDKLYTFHQSLVLCRNNAPLVGLAFKLLSGRRSFTYLGDFAKKLKGFVKSLKATSITMLKARLTAWMDEQAELLADRPGKLSIQQDKFDAIMLLLSEENGVDSINSLLRAIDGIAGDGTGPRLSTVHKAKGLEAPDVFILRPDLMPSFRAKTEAALRQENNLRYVAYTRAQSNLYILPGY